MTLFGEDPTPTATPTPSARPVWSATNTRGRCDMCVAELLVNPTTDVQPARWRRVCGDSDTRVCYRHARPLRALDERKALSA